MCYIVLASTSSAEDLGRCSSELMRFEKHPDQAAGAVLLHEHKWYVGSRSGCSCGFRHVMSPELGFGKPVEWLPEEADDIQATAAFTAVVRRLVNAGHKADCVSAWNGEAQQIRTQQVDLSEVPDDEFRFFENYHFVFASGG